MGIQMKQKGVIWNDIYDDFELKNKQKHFGLHDLYKKNSAL